MSKSFALPASILVASLTWPGAAAWAGALSNDLTVGSGGYLGNILDLSLEPVEDTLMLNATLGLSKYVGAEGGTGKFQPMLGLGLEYDPSSRWYIQGDLNTVPGNPNPITSVQGTKVSGSFRLVTRGANLSVGYQADGDSSFEPGAGLSAGFTNYLIDQTFQAVTKKGGVRKQVPSAFNQLRLGLSLTAMIFQDLSLSVSASRYLYDRNLTDVGVINVKGYNVGAGLPVAPLYSDLRINASYRFSRDWTAKLGLSAGRYALAENGATSTASVKLSYRASKSWRFWIMPLLQRDTPLESPAAVDTYFTVGGELCF